MLGLLFVLTTPDLSCANFTLFNPIFVSGLNLGHGDHFVVQPTFLDSTWATGTNRNFNPPPCPRQHGPRGPTEFYERLVLSTWSPTDWNSNDWPSFVGLLSQIISALIAGNLWDPIVAFCKLEPAPPAYLGYVHESMLQISLSQVVTDKKF